MNKSGACQSDTGNRDVLADILRILSMSEKAFDRLKRKNWHHKNRHPDYILEIDALLIAFRAWIDSHRAFSDVPAFIGLLSAFVERICRLIADLITRCTPENGKKREKRSRAVREEERLLDSLWSMVQNMAKRVGSLQPPDTLFGTEIEKAMLVSFERHLSQKSVVGKREPISKRGQKTCVFPWPDADRYADLVNNRKRFRNEVLTTLPRHLWGHKPGCGGESGYRLKGFRQTPRKTIMAGGEQRTFPIRMAQCVECGEKFSLLPSFLPREKHFCIDIIGEILRQVFLFGLSIRGAFESSALTGRKLKSVRTIMNWIKWTGYFHPAETLTRAGVKSRGYFQEDEGFEKEPNLRTYSVVMVDSESLLVWHMDYVDRADEETLCGSFEKFAERIDFKVCGVTKDKWRASTKALKSVFHQIWIGFCHRHFLKKLWRALSEWRKETGCAHTEVKRAYGKMKKILATANSKTRLRIQTDMAEEPAFDHPSVRPVIDELKKTAVHYTVQIKDNIASEHSYDVKRLVKYLKEKERNGKHKIVDLRATKRVAEPIASADLQGSTSLRPANR